VTATKPVVDGDRPPRREVILDCAARLFAERGYEGTTLGDLAAAASIAKATLFHYFSTKEKILFELYNHAVGTGLDSVRSVEANTDPEVELRAMLREHALAIMRNERLYQIFFSEEKGLEPEHREIIRAQQVTYLAAQEACHQHRASAGRSTGHAGDWELDLPMVRLNRNPGHGGYCRFCPRPGGLRPIGYNEPCRSLDRSLSGPLRRL